MIDCGILYVAVKQDRYVEEALLSADSVKQRFPRLSIVLFTDRPQHALCASDRFDAIEAIASATGFGSTWAEGLLSRAHCLSRTPYTRTLHLDTDTRVITEELPSLFAMLEEFDVAMAETATDDSYSRHHFGRRMFNGGLVLYRRNERVWAWLEAWAKASEENFRLAGERPLPPVPRLSHVTAEDVRRRLLFNDQISLVEMLSPEVNRFDLAIKTLDYSWNHRGSRLPANNRAPVRILHAPALKGLTHADILSVAFAWRRDGRESQAAALYDYIASKYVDSTGLPRRAPVTPGATPS
jgi:hypothetical protein